MIEIDKLRNVGILGHGGVGKTSLGEAMLFAAGAAQRPARVADGTSILDFEPEEVHRRISLSTAFHSLSWKKFNFYLIDTPGYATFLPDALNSMRAFRGSVLLLSPSSGLRVETERLWARADEQNVSRLIFIGKMEREKANVREGLEAILSGLEAKGVELQLPIGAEEGFKGIVDLVAMKAFLFEGDSGKFKETEIPSDLTGRAQEARVQMLETVADTDDALLEKYLEAQDLPLEELKRGIRAAVLNGKLFPIFYGSAFRQIGIPQLLDAIIDYLPSPPEEGAFTGKNPVTGEVETRACDPAAPASTYVFKTLIDPFAGKLSIMRVVSGKIATDMTLYNPNKQAKEKIGHVFRLEGKKQESVHEAVAGEIIAAAKLKDVSSGDTLCDERAPVQFDGLSRFTHLISFALEPKTKADEEKLSQGLHKLMEEDPTIDMHRDTQTREFILSGMGQIHIEVMVEKLRRKYGAEVELKAPKVPYKETIKASASSQGKLKKQSGGRGQYGDTWIKVEPLPRGKGFEFVDQIVGGAIPRNYIPAVEKGIREAMAEGHLAGYQMVDIRATLYDGSYHDVDSSDMAFKIAASMGFKACVEKARPIILEPVMHMEITVPDENMGAVIGDLNSRRGKVEGMETRGHTEVVKARVPMAEVLKYSQDLNAMTSGRGGFTTEFSHYEELPPHLVEKVVKQTKDYKAATEAAHKA
ncbi:MAG: translation elongation factor G [Deltaproteobacteria bacterium RIFCSPLOWO2_12_FULL_60_19]|nr:MAG: translation elongation factor G [Deltaproteobacteria bacterium RIFCSPLOWO2_12_FULL_60_19]